MSQPGNSRTFSSHSYSNNNQPFQSTLIGSSTSLGNNKNTATSLTQEKLYCDSCQTFRHVSFFDERDFKYNVCNMCHSREVQKRKHQLERYELYEEQQRTLKQARYQSIQQQKTTPITLNPQQHNQSPSITCTHNNTSLHQNNKHLQSQLQSHIQPIMQPTMALPSLPHSPPSLQDDKSIVLPTNPIFDTPTPKPTVINNDKSQDIIDLNQFVKELEKETEFDRKQYHLDIEPLMTLMGNNAGFTQLGRGICEKVLEGTTFNFSLKDRRRSTKSPDTLSTLRYYCSQRSDTAKPRKADNPKVQNRYDCAGALTIIIDLLKKTAHVTVIHKHQHPPFVSQHHHQQQQKKAQQQTSLIPQQDHVNRQYDVLRQKVVEIGLLLEGQQRLGNADFLQTATEALSEAQDMLSACQSYESTSLPLNKYTMHYNKTGDF